MRKIYRHIRKQCLNAFDRLLEQMCHTVDQLIIDSHRHHHCATADARYRIGNADHNTSQYVLKQIHNLFLLILSQ